MNVSVVVVANVVVVEVGVVAGAVVVGDPVLLTEVVLVACDPDVVLVCDRFVDPVLLTTDGAAPHEPAIKATSRSKRPGVARPVVPSPCRLLMPGDRSASQPRKHPPTPQVGEIEDTDVGVVLITVLSRRPPLELPDEGCSRISPTRGNSLVPSWSPSPVHASSIFAGSARRWESPGPTRTLSRR